MKYANRLAIVATLAMSAAAAQAAGFDFTSGHYPPQAESQSTLTRAQVKAQTMDALAQGQLLSGDASYLPLSAQTQQPSTLSREQVRQETVAAGKAGLLDSYGE
ncbi:DUF4148 domain-containing protein [Comamonas sp.]|uniref:DUF4148 domain-containing protein n=1 Tax=Comamonas sp. TaxID=34028 RepID=UPI003A8DB3E5